MTAAKSTNQAQLKWAERDDKVWVTVNHPSPTDVKTDLTETGLKLSFTARDMPYACEFEFLKEIKTEDTKQSDLSKARMLEFCFFKKEEGEWGKLAKAKAPWIQCDWDKFEDSDDEDAKGGGDFDMSQMMGMGGMGGGMPGMGGDGGMDMSALASMMGKGGGKGDMPDFSNLDMDALKGMNLDGAADGADSDDDLPDLEEDAEKVD